MAFGLGWPLSPSRPFPPIPRKVPCVCKPGLGLHPIPSSYLTAKKSLRPLFLLFLFGSHRLFFPSLSIPSPAFDPHQRRLFQFTACSPRPLSPRSSSSSHHPTPPPLPAGILLIPGFDDGATIKLPDPSTSQGGLSRIDAQPRRPAAHDIVLGYGNIISSRLARRCQSRQ